MEKDDIREITLGPRQLTFDFEDDVLEEQGRILSGIHERIEKHGYVFLEEYIEQIKELHDLPGSKVLQHIFWLVQDLRIHFRMDGKNIQPHQAKKILLKSTAPPMKIISNKPVDDSVIQDAMRLYQKVSGATDFNEYAEQYEFSRVLVKIIRKWEKNLQSCKIVSRMPHFPGRQKIEDRLSFLKSISGKQDSFSLINAFYRHKKKILRLAEDVETLSEFYARHTDTWAELIQCIEAMDFNLPGLKENSAVRETYDKLKQILESSSPYEKIDEVNRLLKEIGEHYREAASAKIDHMIVDMEEHLDDHGADGDLRNKALYFLKTTAKKQIGDGGGINAINLRLNDVEDTFDEFWEEIESEGQILRGHFKRPFQH